MMGVAEDKLQDCSPGMQHEETVGIVMLWHVSLLYLLVWWLSVFDNTAHLLQLCSKCYMKPWSAHHSLVYQ